MSNDEKDDLVERLAPQIGLPRLEDVTTAVRYGSGDGPCGDALSPGTAGRTALTLRVQTGCDETCSYCIIPTTRGKGRSRPLNAVVRQIEDAVASGYREIAIAGVHLGSYGRDLNDGTSLDDARARALGVACRRALSDQLTGADGLHGARSSI